MASYIEGLSETVGLLRRTNAMTRAELVRETGLSRSAVNLRIDALLASRLIVMEPASVRGKGRPAEAFSFNCRRGKLLAVDVGVTRSRAGLCDLAGGVEAEVELPSMLASEPARQLKLVLDAFEGLLDVTRTPAAEILGIGVSLPAPIKASSGMAVNPPIMPLWDRFSVSSWLQRRFACPIFLEKDANAMAYGEAMTVYPDVSDLLFVKLGTGIGSGLIQANRLVRGADGAAGDLGHILITPDGDHEVPLCKCGNRGCLEAYAGGWALLRDLRRAGHPVESLDQAVALLTDGDTTVVQLVRQGARLVGAALATAVNLLNPRKLIVGGQLAAAGRDHVLPAIREQVYSRSLPLATAELSVTASSLHPRGGLVGLAHLISDGILAPDHLERLVAEPAA